MTALFVGKERMTVSIIFVSNRLVEMWAGAAVNFKQQIIQANEVGLSLKVIKNRFNLGFAKLALRLLLVL